MSESGQLRVDIDYHKSKAIINEVKGCKAAASYHKNRIKKLQEWLEVEQSFEKANRVNFGERCFSLGFGWDTAGGLKPAAIFPKGFG